jgi:gliding motility-associated-like protein
MASFGMQFGEQYYIMGVSVIEVNINIYLRYFFVSLFLIITLNGGLLGQCASPSISLPDSQQPVNNPSNSYCTTFTIDPSVTGHPFGFCLNLSHTWQGDLSIRVIACGNTLMLLTRPGGGSCNAGAPFGSPADLSGQYCFYDTGPDPDNFLPLGGGNFGLSSDRCNINTVNSFAELAAACGNEPYQLQFCITDHANANTGLASNITPIFPNPAICGCTNPAATNYNPNANVDDGSCVFMPCQLALSAVINSESCGLQNGSIQLTINGGSGNQTIEWSNGVTGNLLNNLIAGSYTVTVSDLIPNCTAVATFVVNELPPLEIELELEDTTCGELNGSVQVNIGFGIGPNYQYQWSEPWMPSVSSISNLPPGNYSVTVTDDGTGCTAELTFDISPSFVPIVSDVIEHTSCGEMNGSVLLDVINGSGYYSFNWNNPNLEGEYLQNLSPGDYQVTITDEIFGCELIFLFTIFPSDPFIIDVDTIGTTCGLDNGSIFISILQGVGPFFFEWNGLAASNSPIAEQVPYGIYGIEVIDNNSGCSQYVEVEISESEGFFAFANTLPSSCGLANGSMEVITELGSGQFSFVWQDFINYTSSSKDELSGGNYKVTVTDELTECIYIVEGLVENSFPITIQDSVISTSCNQDNGAIYISITNGSGNFEYAWSNGNNVQQNVNLAPGNYQLTVTDQIIGCIAMADFEILPSEALEGMIIIQSTTCGENNGVLTAQAINGTGPFSYQWSNGNIQSSTVSNLVGDQDYMLTITDSDDGCLWVGSAYMPASEPLLIDFNVDSLICGPSDANIYVILTNSSGNVTYTWLGFDESNEAFLTSVAAGNYTVEVNDIDRMCTSISSIEIPSINEFNAFCTVLQDESILGEQNGSVELQIFYGKSDFQIFLVGPKMDTLIVSNRSIVLDHLPPGIYTVIVEDHSGCIAQCGFEIIAGPCGLAFDEINTDQVSCYGGNDGMIFITTNSNTPVDFSWDIIQLENSGIQANLTAGAYSVTITDALGCQLDTIIEITQPPLLTIECSVLQEETFKGLEDGIIETVINGGVPPYQILLLKSGEIIQSFFLNNSGIHVFNLLAPGAYTIKVEDSRGCENQCSDQINEGPCGLELESIVTNITCFGGNDGQVRLDISQAIGSVTINWMDLNPSAVIMDQSVLGLSAGTISVSITDEVNCIVQRDIVINQPLPLSLQCTALPESEALAGDGSISIELMHYNAPFTVQLSGPINAEITAIDPSQVLFNSLIPGTYSLLVVDNNGCIASCTAIVNPADCTLELNLVETSSLSCFQSSNGFIEVVGIDGTGVLRYLWNGIEFQNGERREGLSAGQYIIQVIDIRGCSDELRIILTEPDRLLLTADSVDPSCGEPNGSIELQISGGTPEYSIFWQDGSNDKVKSNLNTGNYTVTVVDANDCSSNLNIGLVMNEGPEVSNVKVTPVRCYGESNGQIEIEISTANDDYQVSWSNGISGESSIQGLFPGIYQLTIVDSNGCEFVDQYIITEPLPLDFNSSIELGACGTISENSITLNIIGGTPPYQVTGDLNGIDTLFYSVTSGRKSITIFDENNCSLLGDLFIPSRDLPFIDAGSDLSITCRDSIALLVSEPYTDTLLVRWIDPSGQLLVSEWSASVSIPGAYVLEIEDPYSGCTARDTVIVNDHRSAITFVDLNYQDPTCYGQEDAYIRIEEIEGGTAPFTILFNGFPSTSTAWLQLGQGTYSIDIEDVNGCKWPIEQIQLIEPDTFYVTLPKSILVDRGTSLTLDPIINFPDRVRRISWISNGSIICNDCESLPLNRIFQQQENIHIELIDQNGCIARASTNVFVRNISRIFIPDAFTPNGDGINDHFFVYGDEYFEGIALMEIFDRWGSMVFRAKDLKPDETILGWDGTFRGRPSLPGTYVYHFKVILQGGGEETFYGEVILLK